jgi:hypothetical protein
MLVSWLSVHPTAHAGGLAVRRPGAGKARACWPNCGIAEPEPRMKCLALLTLLAAFAASAAATGEDDWKLRIKKEADGWSASFSGPVQYGSGHNRIKGSGVRVEKTRALGAFSKLRIEGPFDVKLTQAGSARASRSPSSPTRTSSRWSKRPSKATASSCA